jgi:hypothetical protein
MGDIVLPDGSVVNTDGPSERDLLFAIAQNTAQMGRMLDMLVRLECGALKRAKLKSDILEAEEAIAKMQRPPTAQEAVDAAEAATEGEALTTAE